MLAPEVLIRDRWVPDRLAVALREWSPRSDLGRYVREVVAQHLPADMMAELIEKFSKIVVIESALSLVVFRQHGGLRLIEDYGVVGRKMVTTAGVGYIVDAFQNLVELENMKFHGLGTGSTGESVGDTALVAELTTETVGNVRATGTTTENGANVYETVATTTLDGTPGGALREHGIFNQAATGGGVLLDRTVFAAITLSSGDALQSTYDFTCSAGG